MYSFIKIAIEKRKVTIILSLILMIFGLYSYYVIPKQENPDISSPAAMIVTVFPGASASDVEALVTKKIEDEAAALEGIESIESVSKDSVSIVIVSLNTKVDKEKEWDKLRNGLMSLKPELPKECYDSVVDTDLIDTAGMIISLSGENYTYEQLAQFGEVFKKELAIIDGVKKFEIEGEIKKQIKVEIDMKLLNQYAVSIEDIYNLLRAQNLQIPSGQIETKSGKINVNVKGFFENLRDIENIIITISSKDGSIVKLKDIADVYFELEEGTQKYSYMGKPSILLTGFFEENQNIVLIGKEVRRTLDQLKLQFPSDLKIDEVLFQPEEVETSVNEFLMNLVQGIILVLIVVFLGMGIRNAIIVSTTIPLSILITVVLMNYLGIEVQTISIAALIISLGILVDNSIVISDAIQVKINEGMYKMKASLTGTKESAIPVFTSTLTTIAAFLPLTALPGEAGEFVQSLPIVVMIALIVSYLVAILVTPALALIFFVPHKAKEKKAIIRMLFEKMLGVGLKYKKATVFLSIVVFFSSLMLINFLTLEIFPTADKNMIYIDVLNEEKGDIEKTENIIFYLEEQLMKEAEVLSVVSSIGGSLPKFYVTVLAKAPGLDTAQMMITYDLKKGNRFEDGSDFLLYLQEKYDQEILGGRIEVKQPALTTPGSDIDINISGDDREVINRVAEELERILIETEGTYNVMNDISKAIYQYDVQIDTDKASSLGLTKYDIQYQINIALHGGEASIFRKEGKEYSIVVKSDIKSIKDLENFGIKSSFTNKKILLKQVADISLGKELNVMNRFDRKPSANVSGYVKPGFSAQDIQKIIENKIDTSIDTSEVDISFEGEDKIISKYMSGLGIAAIFALAAIYIILLIQFNSLKQPLIILMTVPLSIVGSLLVLFLFRQPLSFTVGLGIASLIGIVVNNAILIIEYINRAREDGLSIHDACIGSVDKRFQPIMLSTTTTVIGLVPLAISGSSFFTPMAYALMGGLMVSTVLTLIIIPTLYSLVEK